MAQVIIYKNPTDTNVCVCHPAGSVDINTVLARDCPWGAVIVNSGVLPTGADAEFFNAWVLNSDNTISVNIARARSDYLTSYNAAAITAAQARQLNTLIGITNTISDSDWLADVIAGRTAIADATTTSALIAIGLPTA
jgi:hypothetical protein